MSDHHSSGAEDSLQLMGVEASDVATGLLQHARELWLTVGSASLVLLLGLCAPVLTQKVFDDILPAGAAASLTALIVTLLLVRVYSAAASWVRARATMRVEACLRRQACATFFDRLLHAPFELFMAHSPGDLLKRADSADEAAHMRAKTFVQLVELGFATAYVGVLAVRQPSMGAGIAAVSIVVVGGAAFGAAKQSQLETVGATLSGHREQRLHSLLAGVQSYRSTGTVRHPAADWFRSYLAEAQLRLRQGDQHIGLELWIEGGRQFIVLLALAFTSSGIMAGQATVGELVANSVIASAWASAVAASAHMLSTLFNLRVHRLRAAEITSAAPSHAPMLAPLAANQLAIDVRDAWFRYRAGKSWVLASASLQVPAGKVHYLRAPSGSGKSTLLRIIAGVLPVESGRVTLASAHGCGSVFYLPQKATLMEGTILSNLKLFSGAGPEQIYEAAARTKLLRWLTQLPMGFETSVGFRGRNMSGGQRQLVLLTAAVACDSASIVLLDEPMSEMDLGLRQSLSLERLFPNRTVVCVTHCPES